MRYNKPIICVWLIRAELYEVLNTNSFEIKPSLHYTQGDICELGRVLMQGSFSVWISHKRGPTRMKELARFKPMQRHLFLYERALLFCKRREEHGDGSDKTPSYSFKHCLKVCVFVCVPLILLDNIYFEFTFSGSVIPVCKNTVLHIMLND